MTTTTTTFNLQTFVPALKRWHCNIMRHRHSAHPCASNRL